MGKIKTFYKNNRIYCILMAVSILCLAIIAVAFVMYFFNQTKSNAYGNRLNGIENIKISEKQAKEKADKIAEDEKVEKASVNVKGKIVYITVYLKDGKREDAETIAIKSLESLLTEDEKEFYDISFAFVKPKVEDKEGFTMMGYKKSDSTIISWTKANGE